MTTQAPRKRPPRPRRARVRGARLRHLALAAALGLGLATCAQPEIPVGLSGVQQAAAGVPSAQTLDEMRALESQIVEVAPQAIAATVGIRVRENQGSGVVVSPEGLVLTAWHVIGEAGLPALIYMPDGRRLQGTTLESNPSRDSGMIRIDTPGTYPFARVLDDGEASLGTWCLATGHPEGFQRGRTPVLRVGRVISYRNGFLQSDCPIFSGDSGGPLFDVHGRVIGIHSRIRENLSFNLHVPSSAFVRDWNFLVASGPLLGIQGEDAPGPGARVTRVMKGLAADEAKLLVGDVILAFDGELVDSMDELARLVRESAAGERVELRVRRGEREFVAFTRLQRRGDF